MLMQMLSTMQNMTPWTLYLIRCSPICLASVLSALEIQDYNLPETLEKTPIGGKFVVIKWKDKAEDVMDCFDKAIRAYDSLIEEYEAKAAA